MVCLKSMVARPIKRALPQTALALCVASVLSGCALTDIFKSVQTDYSINRNENDAESSDYLQSILEERIREKTKTLSDDAEELSRQEDYIEQTVRADLLKALRAKGYYESRVIYQDGGRPFTGQYAIEYGPQYFISSVKTEPDNFMQALGDVSLLKGTTLDAERVLQSQGNLYNQIQKGRCYFKLTVENQVYLDQKANTGEIEFLVDAGREGQFSNLSFKGNGTVKESYLRKLVPWRKGDCFRRDRLEQYKTTLLQSGLFSRAEFVLPEEPAEDGSVPVELDLSERAHRSISAGLTYYSDEGPGVLFGWEHRNLLGGAEILETSLKLSSLQQSLDAEFTKPFFIRKDQTLSANASIIRQDTDAYNELGINGGLSLNRKFTRHLTGSTGVAFSISEIEDMTENETKTFGLVSLPQSLSYDTRDDKLDPRKGWNLLASLEPFFDTFGNGDPFLKAYASGSGYLDLGTSADIILASRAAIGSLSGAALENIPATERFYAGGGGTVRGFGYQEVGPQVDGDPTGGRSIINLSLELRSKFTSKIGGVAFVDAANVSENTAPDFDNLAIGAGVGLRYYTDFGPIRFDVATPLTQKDNLDQNYQFYISIGQAF